MARVQPESPPLAALFGEFIRTGKDTITGIYQLVPVQNSQLLTDINTIQRHKTNWWYYQIMERPKIIHGSEIVVNIPLPSCQLVGDKMM